MKNMNMKDQPTMDMNNDSDLMQHGGEMMHMGNITQKFWVSLVVSIPVVILSPVLMNRFYPGLAFPGSEWLLVILASFMYLYGGAPFLRGARAELKDRHPEMMTLIAIGISVSYFYSIYAFIMNTFVGGTNVMDFFWELATLIDIMLLGHVIEMNAVMSAGNALQKMAALLPNDATLVGADGTTNDVPLSEVQVGQTVLVKAGENIPTDGTIVDGQTSVNEAMVTGEARDVTKGDGDKVIGGSTNGAGVIRVKVTGTGESGYLSQVMRLVNNAQKEKSNAEGVADRVAGWLVYVAVGIALIAFVLWWIINKNFNFALERMVTILVIACPHALGLAIPLVVARSTSIGAKNGLLTRKRQAMEDARHLNAVMMDKTGTLTEGNFAVSDVESFTPDYDADSVLAVMGGLETGSSHPLSVGIIKELDARHKASVPVDNINNLPGTGIEGNYQDQHVAIVNERYVVENKIDYDQSKFNELSLQGNTVSFLVSDDRLLGWVAQGDQLKESSKALIDGLKARGIRPVMLTGDNKQVAELIAKRLGIPDEDVHGELKPEDKEVIVKQYQDQGLVVAMVGDGVNDAPSLVRADIGIAIGAGTDVAVDSADIVLVRSDPSDILHFLDLAHNTTRKMVQNLWFGAGYNIFAIPLAAGILAFVGVILSPAVGALLMGLSTVVVAINAQTLKI
ncbi:heavy metal translocating P-type ATPase [Furfurilactobacillus milii]|uniref:P-type Cu(+) transporter n=1 Tax=Furfurilactobacillus milii TaxID=2888272 RepID=A0ABT6D7U1_9LACO|nr:heavy metal translocating P-type ATPase [Furfurilactobacillus milii]QLE65855.1 Lead cadmium zinc and mercury transporting ATPase [Furfurilactobacillus rossiae]MCF6160237.1 cadmium-translocating P-type ATPase [Furfurilactobacillus milii]MCF6162180.1 cadmium-translocating P-type ATPase [Furfurilactobacillus milii]MDF9913199.1 copper-translocating P-type ATPase [Furfurilactobacillus milii]QLE68285.1 Lead cadmium zinc and mercury transporting ATPase [Furfurilactobacillus rossiae]